MSLTALVVAASLAAAPPKPFTQVASVEGVTEYRLPNGLRILFVPDESVATVTVNMTVLVGSRHEGYGEKGMAHLLEHMLFKGSPKYKDPKKEMGSRGAEWNGTTRQDRTNYFETLNASDANADFAIRFEADRLVNAFVAKKDLDTEMTVVRNEFEASETRPQGVLANAVRAAALPWHNYGRAVIGIKADIELVPIDNLKAFYARYYQPDNSVLVIAGRFDEAKAFKSIADSFGKIAKPTRVLPSTFTTEPTQDGERTVTIRRVGGAAALSVAWRIPAATDPDFPALMVLQGVLGDQPQGRLHQALVDGKKASQARCDLDEFKEPGLFTCSVGFKEGDNVAAARDLMLTTMETVKPIAQPEFERSATGWISQAEQTLTSSQDVGLALSEYAAAGDWRLFFVQRDRLKKVTADDLQRVWSKYFKASNRTLGEYVPTAKPDRAEVPRPAEVGPLVNDYKGGPPIARGEAFDASPANIEKRSRRVKLANGAQLVLLPKKTRAESVRISMRFPFGTLQSLSGTVQQSALTAALMNRGTKKLPYKDFRSALERLRAQVNVGIDGQELLVDIEAQRPNLAEVLAITDDVLKQPALDAKELDVARAEILTRIEHNRTEPNALGNVTLLRATKPYPKTHPYYVSSYEERPALFNAVTVDQVRAFHAKMFGAQNGSISVVGDFDDAELEKTLTAMFGSWTAKEAYTRIPDPFVENKPQVMQLPTPDKANAWYGTALAVKINQDSPDFPALALATQMLGGGPSSRLFVSLREEKGLSYGAYAFLDSSAEEEAGLISTGAIYAPQNLGPVDTTMQAELAKWSTVSKDDLKLARDEFMNQLAQQRTDDAALAKLLSSHALHGRTMNWDAEFEKKIEALTPEQLSAAVKKYADPSKWVVVKAGDFKTITAPK
ncbi:MAG: pitrilysin family protein [Archangium sp.]